MPNYSEIVMSVLWIAGIPAVIALVNWVKRIHEIGRWSGLLAVVFGVILNLVGAWLLGADMNKLNIGGAIIAGIIVGLSASGVYDIKNN